MIRRRSLSRLATRLVAVVPLTALFAASCGSSSTVTDEVNGADSAPLDGSALDGPVSDGTGDDDSTPLDGSAFDAPNSDGSGEAADSREASDGQVVDALLVTSILGSADKFAVFAGGTVENAAATATMITGDLGTYPGTTAVGPTPPVVVGTMHLGDGVAATAANDIAIAYSKMLPGTLPCGTDLTGLDLGGKTLAPGVYCFASTAGLTGTLTLDAQHKLNAVWVFQIGSALTTAANSQVIVVNGAAAQVCNAFWQITSAATLGTSSVFGGNILAYAAITVTSGTSIVGRTFALTAKASTDANYISIAPCPVSVPTLDGG